MDRIRLCRCLGLAAVSVALLMAQCAPASQRGCIGLERAEDSSVSLRVAREDTPAVRDALFESEADRQNWQQTLSLYTPTGSFEGWATLLRLGPKPELGVDPHIVNPVRLPAHTEVRGLYLVRNAHEQAHDLGIIFLLDHEQLAISRLGEVCSRYDLPGMDPQEDRAFEFALPGLPEGLHQLSIILVGDPYNLSTDPVYRYLQRSSFIEERHDLWVGIDAPPEGTMLFQRSELAVARAAAGRAREMELVSRDGDIDRLLAKLSLQPGQTYCVSLRLHNCGVECRQKSEIDALYDGPFPLRIVVFWDDRAGQVVDYDLAANAPDNLTLPLRIQAATEAETHQLWIAAFTFPACSQFDSSMQRVVYPWLLASQRVVVDVR